MITTHSGKLFLPKTNNNNERANRTPRYVTLRGRRGKKKVKNAPFLVVRTGRGDRSLDDRGLGERPRRGGERAQPTTTSGVRARRGIGQCAAGRGNTLYACAHQSVIRVGQKMASVKFLEEVLSKDVDENAFSAIVVSLESELVTNTSVVSTSNRSHHHNNTNTNNSTSSSSSNNAVAATAAAPQKQQQQHVLVNGARAAASSMNKCIAAVAANNNNNNSLIR